MRRRIRWKLKLPRHPSRTTTITTKHRRTRRVINWIGIPKELMMMVIPWWTKMGPPWYQYHRKDILEEDVASSLTAWAQGYREVRKNLRDSVTGRGCYKPESSRHKNVVRKTMFRKQTTETRPKHPHSIPRHTERSQHRMYHWSRVEKTHPLLQLQTTGTYGERVSEPSTEGHPAIFSQ